MAETKFFEMQRIQMLQLLLISGLCSLAIGLPEFHLVTESKTFTEAKTFCREMYTGLASVRNLSDINKLLTIVSGNTTRAFIGLENVGVWKWHWSSPDHIVTFTNWREGEPQAINEDACAVMDPGGKWFESGCGPSRSFVCEGNRETGGHIFVAENKSWREAQDHCRGLSSDLISIHSAEENEAVRNISMSENMWIGLFKDPWKWSDGSNSSFRFWKPSQPNNLEGQDCAVLIENDGRWNDLKCNRRRDFICRGAKKLFPLTTIQPSTKLSTTTSQLPTNQTTPFNVTSADLTTTVPSVITLSNQPTVTNTTNNTTTTNTTTTNLVSSTGSNVTSAGLTTTVPSVITLSNEPTVTNTTNTTTTVNTTTTNLVSSTKLINETTKAPNTKSTTLHLNTTFQASTGGVSALTTQMTTAAQTTTEVSSAKQPLTLKPSENPPSLLPGNLILIKKNLTWIEAMIFCRRHHIDLVHIPSQEIQQQVAEKAKEAMSPHAWIGLRYNCDSNYWFWTTSSTSCYQNWAPGQGAGRNYPCDTTGAVEATGGQQWVGLLKTERLNFICSMCAG